MSVAKSIGAALVLLTAVTASAAPPQPASSASKPAPAARAATPAQASAAAKPEPETKVVTSENVHALVLPMKGSYMQHQEAFGRLSSYLSGMGIVPATAPFGRYLNDPSQGEDNLVWEVGYSVPADVKAEPPFEIRDIPAGLTAVRVHRGSWDELAAAWPDFVQWTLSHGYQPSGPPLQVFQNFITPEIELRLPVHKTK